MKGGDDFKSFRLLICTFCEYFHIRLNKKGQLSDTERLTFFFVKK